ncbi:MAG TPA: formate dehydrogenase, partial [Syntrophobacteraceae bacterium]|nr:formate dehydrogenase [Syntrophobacteraceae bacterium]
TVCRLCSSCCPVEVEIENNRLVATERASFLPPEQRWPCPKLRAAADIVYSPARLRKPLVREKTGAGHEFRETSWDEALGIVAERFSHFKAAHGAHSVCWLRGMAADWGAPWDYANRLMHAYGSPNSIGNGSVCHVGREMAHVYTYGAMTVPQAKTSKCILVWGKNDLHTNPQAADAILYARQQGARLIVVDPIRTRLAAMADLWLQVKPGHDGLLVMAMIHEIIANGLYDADFVRDWTVGFAELQTAASKFSPEAVAPDIWVDPDEIRQAARLYATTKPACIIDGNGLDMQLNVFQDTRAVCILRALTGNLDQPGGDFIPQPVPARNIQLKDRLPQGTVPITRDYPLFNTFHSTWGLHAQSCLIDAIIDEVPYPIRMLVVQSGNPAVTMTDSTRVRKAFEKLGFMVAIDPFMTQTARYAHVVLPASSCFEKTQLNRAYLRNNLVILQEQVIDCQGDSWPDWKITFELARRMGLEREFPWQTVEEAIDYQLEPAGITVAALRENPAGIAAAEIAYHKYHTGGFATPSGKVELYSQRLQQHGHEPVPYLQGWRGNPISFADRSGEFPLIGISGARPSRFTHSQFHNIPSLLGRKPEAQVDIHPLDASDRDITSGDLLRIETPRGRVQMRARISQEVHRGSIRIAWGWGDMNSSWNLNDLTDDGTRNPIIATPSNRTFMCRIAKEAD